MGNRRPLMAANWKMNLSLAEAGDLLTGLKRDAIDFGKVDVLVAPPFTTLHVARETLIGTDILIAAQNMHWEEKGAFTGEISASMLKEAGCSHVVLGHSERRALLCETREIINRKAGAAGESGLVPSVCVKQPRLSRPRKCTGLSARGWRIILTLLQRRQTGYYTAGA